MIRDKLSDHWDGLTGIRTGSDLIESMAYMTECTGSDFEADSNSSLNSRSPSSRFNNKKSVHDVHKKPLTAVQELDEEYEALSPEQKYKRANKISQAILDKLR